MANRVPEAEQFINKSLELRPNFPAAFATKSEIFQTKGDMNSAKELALAGIKANPDLPHLYFTLSKVKKFTADDPMLEKMKTLTQKESQFGQTQGMSLNFALFKAYEDVKDYDQAFEHLKTGNDIKWQNVTFDSKTQSNSFIRLKETWTKDHIKKHEGKGCEDETPIFILGMPRSGTTLTEQIISSHPEIYGAGELHFLSTVDKDFGFLTLENCKDIGQKYIDQIRSIDEESSKARFITDKMPGNYMRMGLIMATMPNAKIIHCKRNPIDTCLSCYKQLFARGHYWSYNLDKMAEHYALYHDMMSYWKDIAPDRFLEINYEDTVGDFENQARKLIDYVGIEWDDACLTPHKSKRAILTASKGQVRKPIYKTSCRGVETL